MSPKTKSSLLNLTAIIGAIVAVAGITAPVARTVDSRYVKQQSYDRTQLTESLTHKQEVDSIFRTLREVKATREDLDSIKACLRRRKPEWCG